MYTGKSWGFTLIELLVVIAIIGILAALLSVGLPKAIELAKLRDADADLHNIETALATYMTQHGSYPPAYGFYTGYESAGGAPLMYLKPYMARIDLFGLEDHLDRFSFTDDADGDGAVDRLEYTPAGVQVGPNKYLFPEDPLDPDFQPMYIGAPPKAPSDEPAPYIYIPVNKRQADQYATWFFKKWQTSGNIKYMYCIDDGAGAGNNPIEDYGMSFPTTIYDAYVLISVGPAGMTGGITDNAPTVADLRYQYHIDTLRAYTLATRDANENGQLDFDYEARKQGEGRAESYSQDGLYHLPDEYRAWANSGFTGSGDGPIIHAR